ncbi:MAG TPA: hypothetical protein VGS10_22490, partial [Terracidiphilus sp.]|nr:hypothetical protein [Terracidiphilus sp.]
MKNSFSSIPSFSQPLLSSISFTNPHPHFANRRLLRAAVFICLVSLVAFAARAQAPDVSGPAASVNPLIGTGRGPGDSINLFPGATTPFGMVQLSPDTENHGYGYHYWDTAIDGFSMTHMSGPGCANEGDVFFTATTGPVLTDMADIRSPYSHSMESAS